MKKHCELDCFINPFMANIAMVRLETGNGKSLERYRKMAKIDDYHLKMEK